MNMKIEEFYDEMDNQIKDSQKNFISNLNNLRKHHPEQWPEDRKFCEWITIFCKWMEWSTDMCEEMHNYEET